MAPARRRARRRLGRPRSAAAASRPSTPRLRRVVDRPRAGEQRRRARALDLGRDLVERRLHRLDAGGGEVRQVRFGGRPRDVELRRLGAHALERAAGLADARLVLVERRRAASGTRSSAVADAARAARRTRAGPASSAASAVDDRLAQLLAARRASAADPRAACVDARLELAAGLLEPPDLGGERAGALDQRRRAPPWPRRCGAPAPASRSRASNSRRCAAFSCVVGGALIDLDPGDRRLRLLLARLLGAQLLFGRAALVGDLLLLARDALGASSRGCATCSSKPTIAFSCRCCSPCSDGDRGLGRGDDARRAPRSRSRSRSTASPLGLDALAQLLDLALGREDAARFGARAALDRVRRRGRRRRRAWRPAPATTAAAGTGRIASRRRSRRPAMPPRIARRGRPRHAHDVDAAASTPRSRRRAALRRRLPPCPASATTNPTRPALRSRASRSPAAAWSWVCTTTCWSSSPRQASTARS